MAWRTTRVQEKRREFVGAGSRKEKPLSQLCAEFKISRPTGYHWLRRYQAEGVVGMVERSRRPQRSPQRTAAEVEQQVVALRRQRPDWGARKIGYRLRREGTGLPASTIHRIFLRHHLVREADRRVRAEKRFARAQPN